MALRVGRKPIELHFESTQQVTVVPDDEDRFVTTAGEAARACQQAQDSREWDRQWIEMLFRVFEWCKRHEDRVLAGYVSVGDAALNVIICVNTDHYDFSLEDDLADFDMELASQFPLCRTEVMQIPNHSDLTIGLSDRSVKVYGDR